jgi:UDP-3-O-[3-hydroxymyristoyl] glucosamine N-acyltransferase
LTFTLSEIARRLDLPYEGEDVPVERPSLVDDTRPGSLTLAGNAAYAEAAAGNGAAALLLPPDVSSPLPCLRAENPRVAFAYLLALFDEEPDSAGSHASAVIAPNATLHENVSVGANAVIERGAVIGAGTVIAANTFIGHEVEIGAACVISQGACVLHRCRIGDRVRIQAGAVIGGAGFGYEWDGQRHVRMPHVGTVVLEDDVEVGANSTIDRAKTGETRVGHGTKIDNLVQIGHGAVIGPHCLLAGQVGIAGSAVLGAGVVMAGQAGVVDNVTIGAGAICAAQTGVTKDIAGGETYMGMPARPAAEARRVIIARDRLPEILRRLRALEKKSS